MEIQQHSRREFLTGIAVFSTAFGMRAVFGRLSLSEEKNPEIVIGEKQLPESQLIGQTNLEYKKPQEAFQNIIEKIIINPNIAAKFERGLSTENLIEDLNIYYPIYKTVADAYGLNWVDIWVHHVEETIASRSKSDENPGHYGAMQRSLEFFGDDYVFSSFHGKGLNHLQNIKGIRYWHDPQEIATGTRIFADLINSNGGDLRKAYGKYVSDSTIGNFRYNLSQELKGILN